MWGWDASCIPEPLHTSECGKYCFGFMVFWKNANKICCTVRFTTNYTNKKKKVNKKEWGKHSFFILSFNFFFSDKLKKHLYSHLIAFSQLVNHHWLFFLKEGQVYGRKPDRLAPPPNHFYSRFWLQISSTLTGLNYFALILGQRPSLLVSMIFTKHRCSMSVMKTGWHHINKADYTLETKRCVSWVCTYWKQFVHTLIKFSVLVLCNSHSNLTTTTKKKIKFISSILTIRQCGETLSWLCDCVLVVLFYCNNFCVAFLAMQATLGKEIFTSFNLVQGFGSCSQCSFLWAGNKNLDHAKRENWYAVCVTKTLA